MAERKFNPVPARPESGLTEVSHPSTREIAFTRLLHAPRELVVKVWTDPDQVQRWWGPRGFTVTTSAIDVRTGGVWRYVMHGPDGTDYANRITFTEVTAPGRLTFKHDGDVDHEPVNHETTVTFEPDGPDRTRLTMWVEFESAAARDFVVNTYGAIEGGKQTIERMAEHLAYEQGPVFEIARTFDAPRELVYEAVTDPKHLAHWWGPKGMNVTVERFDLTPGGVFLYKMSAANGTEMWGRFVYREIVPPERLVFINSFSDPAGNVTRAPFFDNWPLEVLNTWTFAEAGGRTTISLRGTPFGADAGERQRFESHFESMRGGFGGTLDQLADYLSERAANVR